MIRREKTRAIVLARRKLGEADRLIALFTRRRGVVRVIAKGVRRIPSRRGGSLEPLTHVLCVISGVSSRYYLAAVEPLELYEDLHRDTGAMEGAIVVARAIVNLCEEGTAYESVFDAFHQALALLPQISGAQRSIVESALLLHILACCGFKPHLSACQVCGETQPSEAVILDGREGGWRCLVCHDSFVGTDASLPPRLLNVTRWLAGNPHQALRLTVETGEGQQLANTLRRYLAQVIATPGVSTLAPAYE